VVAMPVLPRRRDEIGEPVEELKRREIDDAVGTGCGGDESHGSRFRLVCDVAVAIHLD